MCVTSNLVLLARSGIDRDATFESELSPLTVQVSPGDVTGIVTFSAQIPRHAADAANSAQPPTERRPVLLL